MKFASSCAALALALSSAAGAQAAPGTHVLSWHPNGKTPAAIPMMRAQRNCIPQVSHHRGSKGPVVPATQCPEVVDLAQQALPPQAIDRGE
jgi:hypothetical protein